MHVEKTKKSALTRHSSSSVVDKCEAEMAGVVHEIEGEASSHQEILGEMPSRNNVSCTVTTEMTTKDSTNGHSESDNGKSNNVLGDAMHIKQQALKMMEDALAMYEKANRLEKESGKPEKKSGNYVGCSNEDVEFLHIQTKLDEVIAKDHSGRVSNSPVKTEDAESDMERQGVTCLDSLVNESANCTEIVVTQSTCHGENPTPVKVEFCHGTGEGKFDCAPSGTPLPDSDRGVHQEGDREGTTDTVISNVCPVSLVSNSDVRKCKQTHTDILQCYICEANFTKKSNLKRHQLLHDTEKAHSCSICGKSYSTRKLMNQHISCEHINEQLLECKVCESRFASIVKLRSHVRWHGTERRYNCDLCEKAFKTANNLRDHEKVHTGDRPFQCSICSLRFRQRGACNKHMKLHCRRRPQTRSATKGTHEQAKISLPAENCDEDEMAMKRECDDLEKYQNHGQSSRYSCEICGANFKYAFSLRRHLDAHNSNKKACNCEICGETFIHRNLLNKHITSQHMNEDQLQCNICQKTFATTLKVRSHLRSHIIMRRFKCDVCAKTFKASNHLRDHMKSHTGEKPFECPTCGQRFSQRGRLNYHIKKHNPENTANKLSSKLWPDVKEEISRDAWSKANSRVVARVFKCKVCNKSFTTKYNMIRHISIHTDERPFKCDTCDRTFREKYGLLVHKATHTGIKPYQCQQCERKFTQSSDLKYHFRAVHTSVRPHQCWVCGSRFARPAGLKSHMIIHGEATHECTICNKRFRLKSRLMYHMKVHKGDRPYQCTQCASKFPSKGALTAHIKHQHGKFTPIPCGICGKVFKAKANLTAHMVKHSGEKNHVCEICSKSFTWKNNLQAHMRSHNKEKPFPCSECGKSFGSKKTMQVHLVTHTGVKAFVCEICGKHFRRQDTLKVHMRIHTETKPYHCEVCDRKFNGRSDFVKHCIKHHGVEPQNNTYNASELPPETSDYVEEKTITLIHMGDDYYAVNVSG